MSQIQDLMDFTFTSRYAQYLKNEKRRETYKEAINRSRQMHLQYFSGKGIEKEINDAYDAAEERLVIGSQRNLQFAGNAVLKKNARAFNCTASYCNRTRFFQEAMWLLLCGCGVGFSVQKHHVAYLPPFRSTPKTIDRVFTIPDSIEGWADSIGFIINCYLNTDNEFDGCKPIFDYSQIRPEGSEFSHGVGKAPGSKPLENAHKKIISLLERCLSNGQINLRPINCYDIIMYSSDAVLAGGIRRSSTICLFSLDDEEMMLAKTGNWYNDNPQRARSNNSVLLLRGKTNQEEFHRIFEKIKQFGEPGFYWADSTEQVPNPCVEISFFCYDTTLPNWEMTPAFSGWQACNLSSINGSKINSKEKLFRAAKEASTIGTLQAAYTNFEYLGQTSINIINREALLGVSITGIMDNPKILLNPELLKTAANIVKQSNIDLAKKIGINIAARTTCIKPEGSSSAMLGAGSGIHPHHSKRYIRRVQENRLSNVAQFYKEHNPIAVEKSVWSANDTDLSILFACEAPNNAILKDDLSALEFLNYVKLVKTNWIDEGRNIEYCTQNWLNNNVSNTVRVKEEEWDDISKFIFNNQEFFTGISFIPASGDKIYNQAPFTEVKDKSEIIKEYGEAGLFTSGIIEEALSLWGDLWKACDSILNNDIFKESKGISDQENKNNILRGMWSNRVKKFSKNYVDDNLLKTTMLLKDIYLNKLFGDLERYHKKVDYTKMIEENNNTTGSKEVACGANGCQI